MDLTYRLHEVSPSQQSCGNSCSQNVRIIAHESQLIVAAVINSDRAALHAPAIRSRLVASRKMLLQDLVDTYGKRKKR